MAFPHSHSPHCHTCGAPVNSLAAAGRLTCDYCGTVHILRPETASMDRLSWLSELGEHDCPLCRNSLAMALVDHQKVEACPKCLGLLMPRTTFASVVTDRRARFKGLEDLPRALDERALAPEVDCPACSHRMETHRYYGPGNVAIDSCRECELVWVDSGELTQIERAPGARPTSWPTTDGSASPAAEPESETLSTNLWSFMQALLMT
jgi:Zn-finger nucleic acid-binding protein/predicted RNA-binding Zn-ribbon protein involved in translation (DUF1610 family)